MSQELATEETVRIACLELQASGETISAANVLRKTRGSKTTVLKHLATVRTQLAEGEGRRRAADVGFLLDLADPFLKALWEAARRQAQNETNRYVKDLLDVQAGLIEDLKELREREGLLEQRVASAELQAERAGLQTNAISRLQELVEQLGSGAGRKDQKARPSSDSADATGVENVLGILEQADHPLTRSEIDQLLMAKGFTAAQAHKERFRVLNRGLAGLALTEKGKAKLNSDHGQSASMKTKPRRAI
jgi:hypothetical protein